MLIKDSNKIRDKILAGLELTSKRLIQNKKDRNLDLVVSEKGKVVKLSAKNL